MHCIVIDQASLFMHDHVREMKNRMVDSLAVAQYIFYFIDRVEKANYNRRGIKETRVWHNF